MRNETGQLLAFAFLSVIPSEGNLLLPLPLPLLLSLLFFLMGICCCSSRRAREWLVNERIGLNVSTEVTLLQRGRNKGQH